MEPSVSAAALTGALLLAAQAPATLTGRIVHRDDTERGRPFARQWAYLHEFRGDSNRVLDSNRTDAAGRYRLRVAQPDTSARYVVAAHYAEVDYFSQPMIVFRGRVPVDPIAVYDTTATGAMRLERRLLAVFRAEQAPGRRAQAVVQEMVEVANPGRRTRIATDTTNPVWTIRLPEQPGEWSLAAGDVTPEAVWLDADTVKLFAPIWPGVPLRASYRYTLATREIRVPVDQWIGELTVLLEDSTAVVDGVPLQSLGIRELEGQRFAAYQVGPVARGAEIRVMLSRGPLTADDLLPFVIAGAALALGLGLWFALRRRPVAGLRPPGMPRRGQRR